MSTPLLHLLVGCNGAGKSTLAQALLATETFGESFPFVNADVIAARRWPGDPAAQSAGAYEVSQEAAQLRADLLAERRSFMTETVFSHESKLDLVRDATHRGYLVWLYVVMIPEDLAVERVLDRVSAGGHHVPEEKIRSRYRRLWPNVAQVAAWVDVARFYDNSSDVDAMREVARTARGQHLYEPKWPSWAPTPLTAIGP